MSETGDPLSAVENSLDRPSAARVYDYFIGGTTNYAIDREFGEQVKQLLPKVDEYAVTCRQFLGRAVRYAAGAGVTQFVDIGSGLPTEGNVHEVADEVRPECDTKVVYIDNEPIALAHSTLLLAETADPERHHAIAADLLAPEDLWERVQATELIDFDQPVALVINAVLHFVKDEQDPDGVLEFYRRKLAPGSLLMLCQMTNENPASEQERQALLTLADYYERTTNPGQLRTAAEFSRFFGDWDMVEPGLVYAPAWHPDGNSLFKVPSESRILAGVARKPA
ncbi:SAM-dependent methyltransferase [Amycolatopsis nigrescens]|uniref:SAM-dependent methyltransferase n=1 Tax=Amycolatopsis nigrescens TaxID=381445 RepID=UPI000363700D|nr:SAM-dependent methyltransferase [Amycolatopsis nigrescens]